MEHVLSEFETISHAQLLELTDLAGWTPILLQRTEMTGKGGFLDLRPGSVHNVSELVPGRNKEIAGVDISIIFNHIIMVAPGCEAAVAGLPMHELGQDGFKKTNRDPGPIPGQPALKYSQHEPAPLFAADAEGQQPALLVKLHTGHELEKGKPLSFKVSIYFLRTVHVGLADQDQTIDRDLVAVQGLDALESKVMGWRISKGLSILVVQVRRPVQAASEQEAIVCEKRRQLFSDQSSVGLNAVGYSGSRPAVSLLQPNHPAEKIMTHKGWLPALPDHGIDRLAGRQVAVHELLQDIVLHTMPGGLRIQIFFLQIEAILALQVAIS